jgi:predicted dehydrogenase
MDLPDINLLLCDGCVTEYRPKLRAMRLPKPRIIDPNSVPSLRWGIIGPGGIAQVFIGAVQAHTSQQIHAVASRTPGRAQEVAAKFSIPLALSSYEDLVNHPEVDVVYIASHMSDHFEHAMLAINAGKHLLIEKPITYSPDEARNLLAAAKARGVLAMEAMWTRYLPQSDVINQLIESGELGQTELLTAAFCADNREIPRLWQKGGGGIVFDMGIYPIAIAQQFMGNPVKISATGRVRPDGMDEESYAVLEYANGGRAQLTMSGIASLPITANCSFEKGLVLVEEQFLAPSGVRLRDKEFYFNEEVWLDDYPVRGHDGLSYQATALASYVQQGLLESPVHSHADTVANIEVAAEITRQIGAMPF